MSSDQRKRTGGADATRPAAAATAAAQREVLAAAALIDAAEARWLAFAAEQRAAGYAEGEARGRAAGYAAAVADVKAAEHALADFLTREVAAGHGRWFVRGEARSRETFGRPHADDYTGGPVAWPELPDVRDAPPPDLAGAA
jgi:hypothetical protein